jgi:hypothetical protein
MRTRMERMPSGKFRRCVAFEFPWGADEKKAYCEDRYCSCGQAVRATGPEESVRGYLARWEGDHDGRGHELIGREEFERRRKALYAAFGWGGYGRRSGLRKMAAA